MRLERVEPLELLGGDLLEGGGDGPLLDIHLLASQVFKLLDGLSQRLEPHGLAG